MEAFLNRRNVWDNVPSNVGKVNVVIRINIGHSLSYIDIKNKSSGTPDA